MHRAWSWHCWIHLQGRASAAAWQQQQHGQEIQQLKVGVGCVRPWPDFSCGCLLFVVGLVSYSCAGIRGVEPAQAYLNGPTQEPARQAHNYCVTDVLIVARVCFVTPYWFPRCTSCGQ